MGLSVSLSQIVYYDPGSKGTDVAKKWRDVYAETRERFKADCDDIAIAHRSFRLRELNRLYQKATGGTRPNIPLGMEIIVEAEKMAGDMYVNVRAGKANGVEDQLRRARTAALLKDLDLGTAEGLRSLLGATLEDLAHLPVDARVGQAISSLSTAQRATIDASDHEARIAALEAERGSGARLRAS